MYKKIIDKHSRLFGLIFALIVSALVLVYRDKFVNLEGYGYLGIFLISVLGNATIVFPIPVILTAFIGGGIFNPFVVGIVTAVGAAIGELTGYMVGYGGKVVIKNDKKLAKIEGWMKKHGLWVLFVLSAIPNPFFDLAGIVAGATGVPVYKYLIVVTLGKMVKFITISFLGAGSIGLLDKYLL
ncbi:MAG: VTT domain-containing protein [bacterium]|nr:VTT domain-containing protein [bacterium]